MAELLFEIGTEELPAGFLPIARTALRDAALAALGEARLSPQSVSVRATPRRIVLSASGLPKSQPDVETEVLGPRVDIAYAKDGSLTEAGKGFLRGRGLEANQAYKKSGPKGEVIAARVHEKGASAVVVLTALLPTLMKRIPFPKTMRWGDGTETFGRPVRWLLALVDDHVVPCVFGGLTASDRTRGHRFAFPEPVRVATAKDYDATIAKRGVQLDVDARRERIRAGGQDLAKTVGGRLVDDDGLLATVADLVETPYPLLGRFEARFLSMPRALLLSEMREHQKYFAVEDEAGVLLPYFVVVAGSEPQDGDAVARGNARVLRSRFEDGAFYFESDRKVALSTHAERLDRVLFQRELGSVGDKVRRVVALTKFLSNAVALSSATTADAVRAAELCKADLVTGVVGEFPELQGTMGRTYAIASGENQAVADAIEQHYWPKGAQGRLPEAVEGAVVGVADRLDTLVGILGIGKAPTGSADPFALRRAAIAVLHIMMEREWRVSLRAVVVEAVRLVDGSVTVRGEALVEATLDLVRGRARAVLLERMAARGLEPAGDIVDAAIAAGADDLCDLDERAAALTRARAKNPATFLALAATFKRVSNLVEKARKDSLSARPEDAVPGVLEGPAERALLDAATAINARGRQSGTAAYDALLQDLATLKPVVDRFFDDTMVMVDDTRVRDARLGLLALTAAPLARLADFTRMQAE